MAEHIWYRHPGTGAEVEAPKDALAQLRQSGWEPMSKKDVTAKLEAADQERADAEAAMLAQSGAAQADDPAAPAPADAGATDPAAPAADPADAGGNRRATSSKES
jgi:hypothetical protein